MTRTIDQLHLLTTLLVTLGFKHRCTGAEQRWEHATSPVTVTWSRLPWGVQVNVEVAPDVAADVDGYELRLIGAGTPLAVVEATLRAVLG